ncbi:MAG: YfcE family phosphodiesterase [Verrucomicrobiota bacterium]
MKVAILSDIHDRLDHLDLVLKDIRQRDCERIFFLGDFCAPFSMKALEAGFEGPIDAVFGNNDGDRYLLVSLAERITFHEPLAALGVDDRRVALHHYPEIAEHLAASGNFDAVFSGHDHQRYQRSIGNTLWANPGEIMGRFGTVSYGVWESQGNQFSCIELT